MIVSDDSLTQKWEQREPLEIFQALGGMPAYHPPVRGTDLGQT